MLDRDYRRAYENVFRAHLGAAAKGHFDECTLPSYAHRNPIIAWIFWRRVEAALALAGEVRGAAVLDFGCGGAVIDKYLADRGCTLVVCENQFMDLTAHVTKSLGIEATLVRDLGEIGGRTFDFIFALDVLEHVDDLDGVIRRFIAHARPGTRMIVSGPTENLVYRVGRILIGYAEQGRFHERTIHDVERAMAAAGLSRTGLRTVGVPVPLFRISVWSR